MTDAHCHVTGGDSSVREWMIGREFVGVHPWEAARFGELWAPLAARLSEEPKLGVGEIGLDRLREKTISPIQREAFETQLKTAAEGHRRVILHGAKCWGQVVKTLAPYAGEIPAFLCHGFSRSEGLLPEIQALGGFVSVGPAVLNDHAVNYRELVRKIPGEMLLIETDRTSESAADCPPVRAILAQVAELRGMTADALEALTDANAERFGVSLF